MASIVGAQVIEGNCNSDVNGGRQPGRKSDQGICDSVWVGTLLASTTEQHISHQMEA